MVRTSISGRKTPWTRVVLAGIYGIGAVIHAYFTLTDPAVYEQFGQLALLDSYTHLWRTLVVPNLRLLLPLVVLFEAGVAVAVLGRGRIARVGNALGGLFQLALVPTGPWGPINLGLALVHGYLLGRSN